MHGVYIIINKKNGKFYIGSSIDISKRWNRHIRDLNNNCHHNIHLQRAWTKYGECNFRFYVAKEVGFGLIKETEQEMLDGYFGSSICYNISPNASGGDNISNHPNRDGIISKISKSVRERLSRMTDDEKRTVWGKSGENNPNYGNSCAWTKDKRNEASIRAKQRFSGPRGDEYRKKISEAGKRYFKDEKNRKRLSDFAKTRIGSKNPFYGKKHSEKTKAIISKKKSGTYRGNQEKLVIINDIIYKSISLAARKLNVCSATILFRIKSKSKKFDKYSYYVEEAR